MTDRAKDAVIVCTEARGVVFGYLHEGEDRNSRTIRLDRPRMAVRWDDAVHGVFGLAATGPTSKCRVSPAPEGILLHKVAAVIDCTPEATEAWEREPWA